MSTAQGWPYTTVVRLKFLRKPIWAIKYKIDNIGENINGCQLVSSVRQLVDSINLGDVRTDPHPVLIQRYSTE